MLEFSKDHVATLVRRTSENSVKAKFVEIVMGEVRRIPILSTSVNKR